MEPTPEQHRDFIAPVIPPEIAKALVAIQKDLEPLERSSTNEEYGSSYTPLEDVMTKALELLNGHGIAVTQPPTTMPDGTAALMTILVHESGVMYPTRTKIAVSKIDPQSHVSSITYMRRKMLESVLGITSRGEDDDGNKGAGHFPKPTDEQLEQIKSLCVALKYPPKQIADEIWKANTRDHATLTIKNLNEKVSQVARDAEARDRANFIEHGAGPPEEGEKSMSGYVAYDDDLLDRLINLGYKTKIARSRFISRIAHKPFIENCDADDRAKLIAEINALETAVDEYSGKTEADKGSVTEVETNEVLSTGEQNGNEASETDDNKEDNTNATTSSPRPAAQGDQDPGEQRSTS